MESNRSMTMLQALLVVLTSCALAMRANAGDMCAQVDELKLLPSDGQAGDCFGWRMSAHGETLVVGADYDDDLGVDAGSVYVFTRTGMAWTQTAKLHASDGTAGDRFGAAIDFDGTTLVIGASQDDAAATSAGSAYVFARQGDAWAEVTKLLPDDLSPNDLFGVTVAVDGDTIMVSCFLDDDIATNAGAVYVFNRVNDTWEQTAKLYASDGGERQQFGSRIALQGDIALFGTPIASTKAGETGAVYAFANIGNAWTEVQKFTAQDAADGDFFGSSLDMSGDQAVIGATRHDTSGDDNGAAYVFTRVNDLWIQTAKLVASTSSPVDAYFGVSVALREGSIVVGAYGDDERADNAGAAFVYRRCGTSWFEVKKTVASDGAFYDRFGCSVTLVEGGVIVGALLDDDNGSASGAVYQLMFECSSPDLDGNDSIDGADLAYLLGEWGTNPGSLADLVDTNTFMPPPDGVVDGADLAVLLGAWGSCN